MLETSPTNGNNKGIGIVCNGSPITSIATGTVMAIQIIEKAIIIQAELFDQRQVITLLC